jgi:hypothetical protein
LEQYGDGEKQRHFAFRGQADSRWSLRTSLARHFDKNPIDPHQWRRRELKMYQMFRERLRQICPRMYDDWSPLDILSLMQHHEAPTRLLDFTFCPAVAAYFAVKNTQGNSAIWVVDCDYLEERREKLNLPKYYGPTHIPEYTKLLEKDYLGGVIVEPTHLHALLAAQRGCFLNTGSISKPINKELVHTKVELSEGLAIESCMRLKGMGIDRHGLFPSFRKLAREVNRFSATGGADFVGGGPA